MKVQETLAALVQELKDFKCDIKEDLTCIREQTTKTNGKVAETIKEIIVIKERQDKCPARMYHQLPSNVLHREWSFKRITIAVAIITAVISIAVNLIIKLL